MLAHRNDFEIFIDYIRRLLFFMPKISSNCAFWTDFRLHSWAL